MPISYDYFKNLSLKDIASANTSKQQNFIAFILKCFMMTQHMQI